MLQLTKQDVMDARAHLDRFIHDDLSPYRPWSSKMFARTSLPYPLSALILFGWTIFALPLLETIFDWPALLNFRPEMDLIAYLCASMIFAAFPVVFTALLYWWERNTFQPMILDLFFLLDHVALSRIDDKTRSSIKDESKFKPIIIESAIANYKNMMLTKVKMNVRLSNSKVLGLLCVAIASAYIYATMLNTGYFFLIHYIPYFFIVFYCSDIIIGSISHVFLMRRILESFQPYLVIFPAHPDGIGGLGPLKELAINSTVVISSTVLAIPWLISITLILEADLQYLSFLALAIVPLLMWLIVSVFFFPTYILYKNITKAKDEKLEALYEDYTSAFMKFQQVINQKYNLHEPTTTKNEGAKQEAITDMQDLALYVNRVKEDYKEVMDMKCWPISAPMVWKLAGSVVLPALMPLINWILTLF